MCLNPVRSTDGRKPCCLSFLTAQAAKLSHLHPHRSPQTPDSLDPSPSPGLSPAPPHPVLSSAVTAALETLETTAWLLGEPRREPRSR